MSTSIFIKTWISDLEWLRYCLSSIKKHAQGFDEIVVVSDASCYGLVRRLTQKNVKVYHTPDWDNGYIQQQWVKLNADKYTDSEYILFVDSDCVFKTEFNPESCFKDDKPILMKTRYAILGADGIWQPITSQFVGWEVEYEYMRRLPWLYRRDSLINFRTRFPQLENHLRTIQTKEFSEFNALGAYIDKYEQHKYFITDTEQWMPESVAQQFWSWGGLTPEIKETIKGHIYATQ